MGAAAAASHLLGLDAARLANAFGIAGSRSGSLLANVGTMTKATHCGLAAAMGLDAALLAERGFTGNSEIFEAANGYAEVFGGGDFDLNALARFGEPFRIIEPGYTIKLFPCQFATQYGITAALDVRSRISNSSEIASVRIVTPVMPYVDRPHPRTGLDGKFSFQFTTACALLDGAVTTESFTDDRRFRADMERLLGRIELVQSSDIPGNLEQMYVDVSVKLAGGATESSRCDGLRGSWGRPPLSPKEHFGKVHDCLAAHLSEEEIESCTAHIGQLEVLPPEKVRILIEMFM
jgi:2-methylcitrate dehydratase PrpD